MSDIFGSIFGNAMKGIAGQLETTALPAILAQVLGKTNLGSVGGLLQQLQQSGLGPQVASWLGNGANMPVSADQLKQGARRSAPAPARNPVRHSARSATRPSWAWKPLPAAVDHMSPNGTLEEQLGPG